MKNKNKIKPSKKNPEVFPLFLENCIILGSINALFVTRYFSRLYKYIDEKPAYIRAQNRRCHDYIAILKML